MIESLLDPLERMRKRFRLKGLHWFQWVNPHEVFAFAFAFAFAFTFAGVGWPLRNLLLVLPFCKQAAGPKLCLQDSLNAANPLSSHWILWSFRVFFLSAFQWICLQKQEIFVFYWLHPVPTGDTPIQSWRGYPYPVLTGGGYPYPVPTWVAPIQSWKGYPIQSWPLYPRVPPVRKNGVPPWLGRMGYPPAVGKDGGPPSPKVEQTHTCENITTSHRSDAGTNDSMMFNTEIYM